ncbi:MAG: sigma-70 family RNA polymerase sigma factor [Catalinimonas sp.]
MRLRITKPHPADYRDEAALLSDCRRGVRAAQRRLYEQHAAKMLVVCRRYLRDEYEAEDALLRAFAKVFQNLDRYAATGSFEGWIRRIVVNEALMQVRKQKLMYAHVEAEVLDRTPDENSVDTALEADDLLQLVQRLPTGYRTVFNLYAIEGYSHQEIAEQLDISPGTSKSQLSRARALLQSYLRQQEAIGKKKASYAGLE